MEVDKTTIAIRQRSMLDILDLSLLVSQKYFVSLLLWAIPLVLPIAFLNYFILRGLSDFDSLVIVNSGILDDFWLRARFLFLQVVLVYIEAPVTLIGVTYFLGIAIFNDKPKVIEFRDVLKSVWMSLIFVQGGIRMGFLLPCFLAWLIFSTSNSYYTGGYEGTIALFIIVGPIVILIRGLRPFAPEILVLERIGIRPQKKLSIPPAKPTTYNRRSHSLHANFGADLLIRKFCVSIAIMLLFISLLLGQLFLIGIFFSIWEWGWWMDQILFPINLWIVAMWATVIRLLYYIDCRTRQEGWELYLKLLAESQRIEAGQA